MSETNEHNINNNELNTNEVLWLNHYPITLGLLPRRNFHLKKSHTATTMTSTSGHEKYLLNTRKWLNRIISPKHGKNVYRV